MHLNSRVPTDVLASSGVNKKWLLLEYMEEYIENWKRRLGNRFSFFFFGLWSVQEYFF